MIFLECLRDRLVHITELRTMTLIEYEDNMSIIDSMFIMFLDEFIELLDGRDDDLRIRVFELFLQLRSTRITIRSSLLELIIFTHRLVVEVFSIHDKKHFIDEWEFFRELCRLKTRQSLS